MTDFHLAKGYRFAGVPCGIRPGGDPNRLDLALVVSDGPAAAAGVFTQNRVAAAPVHYCRAVLPTDRARGIVVCSGNANACTGKQGLDDAHRMAALAAEAVGCRPEQMLVGSTGVIGRHLPMDRVAAGIHNAGQSLASTADAFTRAATAILTTDTRTKVSSRALTVGGAEVRITGFAKGAAMIGPNMATMLAFVLTDAPVPAPHLAQLAKRAAGQSFNCVSVEGHTSTNDTLLFLANGACEKMGAGSGPILENAGEIKLGPVPVPIFSHPLTGPALVAFDQAATAVCADLARAIAADAEGATHLITVNVEGLRSDAEARQVARAVADSPLVKTAVFGADPNWGRIVSAAGYAGVVFEEENLSLWLGDMLLYKAGTPQPFDAAAASAYLKSNRDIAMRLVFTLGAGRCTYWTCDLGYEYIRLNAEYTT